MFSVYGINNNVPTNLIDISNGLINGSLSFTTQLPQINSLVIQVTDQSGEYTNVSVPVTISYDPSSLNQTLKNSLS
jgi:hypothetical protein